MSLHTLATHHFSTVIGREWHESAICAESPWILVSNCLNMLRSGCVAPWLISDTKRGPLTPESPSPIAMSHFESALSICVHAQFAIGCSVMEPAVCIVSTHPVSLPARPSELDALHERAKDSTCTPPRKGIQTKKNASSHYAWYVLEVLPRDWFASTSHQLTNPCSQQQQMPPKGHL